MTDVLVLIAALVFWRLLLAAPSAADSRFDDWKWRQILKYWSGGPL